MTAEMCEGLVLGFGTDSYLIGLEGLLRILERRRK
jgi:3-dehydroquinate dehydratase